MNDHIQKLLVASHHENQANKTFQSILVPGGFPSPAKFLVFVTFCTVKVIFYVIFVLYSA